MPELPEVETVKRGLNKLIINQKITTVTVLNPKSFQSDQATIDEFVIGQQVKEVRRRAKVLMIDLDSDYTLVIHLKMTGQLVYRSKKDKFGAGHPTDSLIGELPDRSTRIYFQFEDGGYLFFNDQRKFGWIRAIPSLEVPEIDFMKKVGPEPLEVSFKAEDFIARIRRRNNTTVKAAILDQTVLAGVGNIYADESLWGAKIHPATRVRNVKDSELAILLDEIKFVMDLSIQKGGSTDRNYVNAEGKRGSYIDFARVFRKEGKDCQRCGNVIEKTRVAGRGTHLCPVCQIEKGD